MLSSHYSLILELINSLNICGIPSMSYKLFLEPVHLGHMVTLSLVALSVNLQPSQISVPPFLVKGDNQSINHFTFSV